MKSSITTNMTTTNMTTTNSIFSYLFIWITVVLSSTTAFVGATAEVVVESISKTGDITLYIESSDDSGEKTRTPSGWSIRVKDGAAKEQPFEIQPGNSLIEG